MFKSAHSPLKFISISFKWFPIRYLSFLFDLFSCFALNLFEWRAYFRVKYVSKRNYRLSFNACAHTFVPAPIDSIRWACVMNVCVRCCMLFFQKYRWLLQTCFVLSSSTNTKFLWLNCYLYGTHTLKAILITVTNTAWPIFEGEFKLLNSTNSSNKYVVMRHFFRLFWNIQNRENTSWRSN